MNHNLGRRVGIEH